MNFLRAAVLVFSSALAAAAAVAAPPNFIFILADDLGWTNLSVALDDRVPGARSDFHETPALEKLAQRGLRFTQGYSPDALCSPTRRSIQFGQTPTRQGDDRFPARYEPVKGARLTIPLLSCVGGASIAYTAQRVFTQVNAQGLAGEAASAQLLVGAFMMIAGLAFSGVTGLRFGIPGRDAGDAGEG